MAKEANAEQWLQVKFDRPLAVYGLTVGGDGRGSYVTSYSVTYSINGVTFSHVEDAKGQPRVKLILETPLQSWCSIMCFPAGFPGSRGRSRFLQAVPDPTPGGRRSHQAESPHLGRLSSAVAFPGRSRVQGRKGSNDDHAYTSLYSG